MRIAVVGGGISGLAAAHACQAFADVTLFEGNGRLGGHTDTHNLLVDGRAHAVDSGFIVFNRENYPLFSGWLDELGVASQPTEMSFGVSTAAGLEYGTSSLGAVFCQRRNALRPRFLSMLNDIRRFHRNAGRVAARDAKPLGDYLRAERYSEAFAEHHLLPMCAALWSAPRHRACDLPVGHVAAFMANHGMTRWRGRPQWRVVRGGSGSYLRAFAEAFEGEVRLSSPVRFVHRGKAGVTVELDHGSERFDYVVLACHSDEALELIDASPDERAVLGAIRYQPNRAVLHSDASVMPRNPAAWSSWNVRAGEDLSYEFTYWMNRLQGLDAAPDFFVTLNPARELDNAWLERDYRHPIFSSGAGAAQARVDRISGRRRTHYCGAWRGWGFHEDGFRSGVQAARRLRGRLAD